MNVHCANIANVQRIRSQIPSGAKYIIEKLKKFGYESYLVGGCVRDMIMFRSPHDWDITTEATPDDIKLVFNKITTGYEVKIIDTGIKHGTVTVIVNNEFFEVTTFRQDGDYSDNRRPDNVIYTKSLTDDLSRRDFTINAIAFDIETENFIDPFNGINDINDKIIRCVGDPKDRFKEDALRILRALRFSAQFDFDIEENTAKEILFQSYRLNNISYERIQNEFVKILNCKYCGNWILREYVVVLWRFIPEFSAAYGYNQFNPFHDYDVWEHTLQCLGYLLENNSDIDDIITRLSVLFHDIGKPYSFSFENNIGHFYRHAELSAKITQDVLKRLRFDNNTIEKVVQLVKYHDSQLLTNNKKSLKKLLNKIGKDQLNRLVVVKKCDIYGQNSKYKKDRMDNLYEALTILKEIESKEECFRLNDLCINGHDLIELGLKEGKFIGDLLNTLLEKVISGEVKNDHELLIKEAHLIINKEIGDKNGYQTGICD